MGDGSRAKKRGEAVAGVKYDPAAPPCLGGRSGVGRGGGQGPETEKRERERESFEGYPKSPYT